MCKRWQDESRSGVLACSALRQSYRDLLRAGKDGRLDVPLDIAFVYLRGSFDVIFKRMEARQGHYMLPTMLQSQLEVLEEPAECETHLTIDVEQTSINEIVESALREISRLCNDW
jgi:gluconokinase